MGDKDNFPCIALCSSYNSLTQLYIVYSSHACEKPCVKKVVFGKLG